MEITHDGQFLFTVNTGSGKISRYSIAPDGTLTLLGSTPVGGTGGVGAVDARLSPDGRYLYVDESRIGAVGAFAVNGGNLTELPGSPTRCPPAPHPQASSSTSPSHQRETGAGGITPRLRSSAAPAGPPAALRAPPPPGWKPLTRSSYDRRGL